MTTLNECRWLLYCSPKQASVDGYAIIWRLTMLLALSWLLMICLIRVSYLLCVVPILHSKTFLFILIQHQFYDACEEDTTYFVMPWSYSSAVYTGAETVSLYVLTVNSKELYSLIAYCYIYCLEALVCMLKCYYTHSNKSLHIWPFYI